MRQVGDHRSDNERIADALEGWLVSPVDKSPDGDDEQMGIACIVSEGLAALVSAVDRLTAAVERLAPQSKNGEDSRP